MVKPQEIYVGASYRRQGDNRVLQITKVDARNVSYESNSFGWMCGSADLEGFAKEATRVFPNRPQVSDVVEILKQMEPEQRSQVAAALSSL